MAWVQILPSINYHIERHATKCWNAFILCEDAFIFGDMLLNIDRSAFNPWAYCLKIPNSDFLIGYLVVNLYLLASL